MPRTTRPLCLNVMPEDIERLREFSDATGRPQSWIVRDALAAYFEAVEKDAQTLKAIKERMAAPAVKIPKAKASTTRGRPTKAGKKA